MAARRLETANRNRGQVGDYLAAQFELHKYPAEGFDQILSTLPNALLQRLQPFQDRVILSPSARHRRMPGRGRSTSDRFSFHLQVDGRIAIRSVDTGMTQPVTDGD